MKKICIITNLHLCDNPRVWKEAKSLAEIYQVYVLTTWSSFEKRQKDIAILEQSKVTYIAGLNLIPEECSWLTRAWHKLKSRLALEAKLRLGLDSPLLLGYDPMPIVQAANDLSADLYICHAEMSLYIGKNLIERGKKVAYDFEDWYSRDYLVPSRPVRLLQELEQFALRNGVYSTCPSGAMAQALSLAYTVPKNIEVIYNGFSVLENDQISPRAVPTAPSLVWFSQTIGPGRGLETLLDSLSYLKHPIHLILIGDCTTSYRQFLEHNFPYAKGHFLSIRDRVLHHELLSILKNATIGLAIEDDFPDNKDFTISNKILQYAQAGIKVLATSTKGQQEVASYYPESIKVVNPGKSLEWAEGIDFLLSKSLPQDENEVLVFNNYFSWEAQEQKLFKLVEDALAK